MYNEDGSTQQTINENVGTTWVPRRYIHFGGLAKIYSLQLH